LQARSLSLALLAVIGTMLALVAAIPADAPQLRGVALHPMDQDKSTTAIVSEFRALHAAGATSVRFDVYWSELETGLGQYDRPTLRWVDWVMRRAKADGLEVILDLDSTPCWASSVPVTVDPAGCGYGWWKYPVGDYPPAQARYFADFAAFAAKRWGRYLAGLELWNEPNGGQSFRSRHPGRDYAALVRAAYPAVKAVAPSLSVIMSLGGTDTRFLGYLYFWGVRGYYDGIAVHPYDQPTLAGLKAFRAYQLGRGDAAPLWVTEVGWSSIGGGLQLQAQSVVSALDELAALPYVVAAELYDMRDGGANPDDPQAHFGLLTADLRPKPAWTAFATTLRVLAVATSGVLPPPWSARPPRRTG
jgi:hypothetical protein